MLPFFPIAISTQLLKIEIFQSPNKIYDYIIYLGYMIPYTLIADDIFPKDIAYETISW